MKTIIFDFDGTLADSMKIVKRLANQILEELGRPALQDEDIEKMRQMTIPQAFNYLKLPIYKLPQIILQARSEMRELIDELPPVEGIESALRKIIKTGHKVAIVTSNSQENVDDFLQRQNWQDIFEFVEAGAGAFNKSRRIKQVVKKYDLQLEECVYVGDEIRDMQAAKAIFMPVIGVGWGVNHPDRLKDEMPNNVVLSPESLVKVIEEMS